MADTALAEIFSRLAAIEEAVSEGKRRNFEIPHGSSRPPDDVPAFVNDQRVRNPRRIRAGLTRGPPSDDDRYLTTREVAGRYSASTRSIDRWVADSALGFPQPFYINQRKYWSLRALSQWDHARIHGLQPTAIDAQEP
jgi:predicted DNA-binding transcriptional regulator AlpA